MAPRKSGGGRYRQRDLLTEVVERITTLRNQLKSSSERRSEAKGRLDAILEELNDKFNIRSLEEVKDVLEGMRGELKKLEGELEGLLGELKEATGE